MVNVMVKKVVVLSDRLNKGQRLLKIDCPYCGKEHTHGGGLIGDDIQFYAGGREPHCFSDPRPIDQYSLIIPEDVFYEYR